MKNDGNKQHELIWYGLTSIGALAMLGAIYLMFSAGGPGFVLLALSAMFCLGARDVVTGKNKDLKREAEMKQLAEETGFSFRESASVNVLGWSDTFRLTKQMTIISRELGKTPLPEWLPGLMPKSYNVLERNVEDIRMAVFDCEIPEDEQRVWHTVIALKSRELNLSYFGLYPREFGDRLTAQFRNDMSVHENYRLIASETTAFEQISDHLLDWLDGSWCLEVGEGFLLLYRRKQMANAGEIELMIKTALEIHAVFAEELTAVQSIGRPSPPL